MTSTSKADRVGNQVDGSICNVLGIVTATRLLSHTSDFNEWMSKNYTSVDTNRVLSGYKFALDALLRLLHDEISGNYSLNLAEDKYFIRARFSGVSLWKLPNTCEKVALLKNMRMMAKETLRQTTWARLSAALVRLKNGLLQPLDQLKTLTTLPRHFRLTKVDDAIRCAAIFQVYVFLNDTRKGYPHGYVQSMLEDSMFNDDGRSDDSYLTQVFEGYKYAVKFLWSRLTPDKINESPFSQMHLAENWEQFDEYFGEIRESVIRPLEQQTGTSFGFDATLQLPPDSKQIIKNLLVPQVRDPELNKRDIVERKFLWYPIELMDASRTTFNGVFPFVTTLTGTVEMRKKAKNTDEVRVLRLRHPVDGTGEKNDYSYALLVEVYGSLGISDASGWLLFFDCCGDYSGTAGAQYEFAERAIRSYLKRNRIDLEEVVVDKEKFLKLMEDRVVLTGQQYKSYEELKKANSVKDKLGASTGILLELLTYFHMFSPEAAKEDNYRIEWSLNHLREEIDVVVRHFNVLTFVECKKPEVEDPIEQSKKFVRKTSKLLGSNQFKREWGVSATIEVRRLFVTWERPTNQVREALMNQGINEVIVLPDESNSSPRLSRRKFDRLKIALDPIERNLKSESDEPGDDAKIVEW